MGRLTPTRVAWIIWAKKRGETTKYVAWSQGVSRRRVQQIWKHYRRTGAAPHLKPPGRPAKPFTNEERRLVLDAHEATDLGALGLEKHLLRHGHHVPHNRIHRVLKAAKKARDEPKKQRRRSWVRYERERSMELWHTDWMELPNGNWFIAYLDDASRFIVASGEFPERSQRNALLVLEDAIQKYGLPDAVLSDRGGEFYVSKHKDKKTQGISGFTRRLDTLGIRHIVARTNHPQTNGKLERFHGEIKKRWTRFGADSAKIVAWHNEVKPHRSLRYNRGETPIEAFTRKYPPERVLGTIDAWFWTPNPSPPPLPTMSRANKE